MVKIVLQSIPIYTLACISPPKIKIRYIKKLLFIFFWGNESEGKKFHWDSWDTLGYLTAEGGIGVRLFEHICKAFQYNQWWKFKTNSLYRGNFKKPCIFEVLIKWLRNMVREDHWIGGILLEIDKMLNYILARTLTLAHAVFWGIIGLEMKL